MSAQAKSGQVAFVGGELDGQRYVLPELKPRYYVRTCRRLSLLASREGFNADAPVEFEHTEYVLTEKEGTFYYVESELMKLSNAEGIDPRS